MLRYRKNIRCLIILNMAVFRDFFCTHYSNCIQIITRSCCRLLLPYERYQRGEETKVRLNHGRRTKSMMSEDLDIKEEPSDLYTSETPPPIDAIPMTTTSPLQSIMSAATTTTVNGTN